MGTESIQVGDHEFQISLTPMPGGGWIMNVLHIDRSRPTATELRSRIDVEFASEAEALRYANVVVAGRARECEPVRTPAPG